MQFNALIAISGAACCTILMITISRVIQKHRKYNHGSNINHTLLFVIALSAISINIYEGFIGNNTVYPLMRIDDLIQCTQWTKLVVILSCINLSCYQAFILQAIKSLFDNSVFPVIHSHAFIVIMLFSMIFVPFVLLTFDVVDIGTAIVEAIDNSQLTECIAIRSEASIHFGGLSMYCISLSVLIIYIPKLSKLQNNQKAAEIFLYLVAMYVLAFIFSNIVLHKYGIKIFPLVLCLQLISIIFGLDEVQRLDAMNYALESEYFEKSQTPISSDSCIFSMTQSSALEDLSTSMTTLDTNETIW